jgi:hypothetical protein
MTYHHPCQTFEEQKMDFDEKTPWLLGAAFLFVFVASLLSGTLQDSAIGSGSMSDKLISISDNLSLMRASILVELLTSLGIVALASLLYIVLHKQHRSIALVALGWWLAEGIILAVSKIGAFALIPLSQEFAKAEASDSAYLQTLGDFYYNGFDRQGWNLHMLFFCLGGILWYSLFFRSAYIPRAFAAWGVISVSLVTINVVAVLWDRDFGLTMPMLLPYVVFEFLIGPWLMIKGIPKSQQIRSPQTA